MAALLSCVAAQYTTKDGRLLRPAPVEEMKQLEQEFKRMDVDKDGFITRGEDFVNYVNEISNSTEEAARLMGDKETWDTFIKDDWVSKADLNGDNKVSMVEILEKYEKDLLKAEL